MWTHPLDLGAALCLLSEQTLPACRDRYARGRPARWFAGIPLIGICLIRSVVLLPAVQQRESVYTLFRFFSHIVEKEVATHSSVVAWRILWTEEPGGLQSMGSQRVGQDEVTFPVTFPIQAVTKY